MKIQISFLALLLVSTVSYCQNFIAPIVSGLSPKDNLESGANVGFGVGLKYQHQFGSRVEAFAAIEYFSFGRKTTNGIATTKSTMLPIQVGAIWFFPGADKKMRYFISGQAGFHQLYTDATLNGAKVTIPDESKFSYSPGVGLRSGKFDLGYRMQWVGTSQVIRYSVVYLSYQIATGRKSN